MIFVQSNIVSVDLFLLASLSLFSSVINFLLSWKCDAFCLYLFLRDFSMVTILFGQVVKTDPTLATLYVIKLLKNFLFRVTCRLDHLPEGQKFVLRYLTVLVHVNSIEKLLCWDLSESSFPVINRFFLINCVVAISVKASKNCEYLFFALRAQFLKKNQSQYIQI